MPPKGSPNRGKCCSSASKGNSICFPQVSPLKVMLPYSVPRKCSFRRNITDTILRCMYNVALLYVCMLALFPSSTQRRRERGWRLLLFQCMRHKRCCVTRWKLLKSASMFAQCSETERKAGALPEARKKRRQMKESFATHCYRNYLRG